MIKYITEKDWIGLSIKEADQKAKNINYTIRIVEENGSSFILPQDYKSNRINLRLKNGHVIGVYTG
jgi:hypothetical protein